MNLVEILKEYLTPDVVAKLAANVGESPQTTTRSMGGMVPTVLAGLVGLASRSGGGQQVVHLLDAGRYDGAALDDLGGLFGGGSTTHAAISAGQGLLGTLFGNAQGSVLDVVTRALGIKKESAGTLLALAVPFVMNVLGKLRDQQGLTSDGLARVLGDQRQFLAGLVPPGLGSIAGLGAALEAGGGLSAIAPAARESGPAPARRGLLPGLALGALALALLMYTRGCGAPQPAQQAAAPGMMTVSLPGGGSLTLREGSFNFNLATYLADAGDTTVPKTFLFDNLNFEVGTTTLTAESKSTVTDLIAILKAYPMVEGRLDGHTDSTGDAAANKKLSLERAAAIKTLLVAGGVAEHRLTTAGHGAERPIASNDTEEGRARNRRTELVITKK
jgi:outer membrane protein OmpA-like peptidoglycan-associated protein